MADYVYSGNKQEDRGGAMFCIMMEPVQGSGYNTGLGYEKHVEY